MEQKKFKDKKSINFDEINEIQVLNLIKGNIEYFFAAMVKMKMVDNFDHAIPSGLKSFATFFFSHHEMIYLNEKFPNLIYAEFLTWLS